MSIAKLLPITILVLITTGCLNGPSHRMPIVGELQVRQLSTGEMCFKPDWNNLTQMGRPFTYPDKLRRTNFYLLDKDNPFEKHIETVAENTEQNGIHPLFWSAKLKDDEVFEGKRDEICMGIEHSKFVQTLNRPLIPNHTYTIEMMGATYNSKYQVGMGNTFRYQEPQKTNNN